MTILLAQDYQKMADIPEWVTDLESFRRWACSDDYPESGWYAHLNGDLWVDTNMERLNHNQIKTKIATALDRIVTSSGSGMFLGDRMLLTNINARLSTEPDGMFLSYQTVRAGCARLENGDSSLEVVGTPDMVLEVVSITSGRKDKVILPELYFEAGITEYWIVEAWGDSLALEIRMRASDGYVAAPSADGWQRSTVFGQSFRLTSSKDPLGNSLYELQSK